VAAGAVKEEGQCESRQPAVTPAAARRKSDGCGGQK
jgi:hypothetical protein